MSDNLCEELIIEIFTRLPAKSLLQFRSVSKSLCRCIGSPGFIRMHASRSPQQVLIEHKLCSKGDKIFYTLHSADRLPLCPSLGYTTGIEAVKFPYRGYCGCVGSCNGILCMFDFDKSRITLWNPSIRRKLPVPYCPDACRAFVTALGFGFDPITDDYKIVSLPIFGGPRKRSYIYTMKTKVWCEIASVAPSYYEASSIGCFVNGLLHWLVQSDSTKSDEVAHFYILTFNLGTHEFGKIVLPEHNLFSNELTIIQGSLAAISTKHDDDDDESCIWVMKEYNNAASWSVFFKWLPDEVKVKGRLQRVVQPNEDGDLLCNTNWEPFQVFDLKIQTRSRLQKLDTFSIIYDIETCVESLQLLEKGMTYQSSILKKKKTRGS